ncbi:MAG: glycosyltransferase [Siphonobacter aquaeclarae]|nr:glycosyltransferase [Siphonobacter aquaeclarae]
MHLVIIARQPWEEKNMGSNIRDMARTLAAGGHQVLFVNQPLDWAALLRKNSERLAERRKFIDAQGGKTLSEVEPNLWVLSPPTVLGSYNWLPDGAIYDWCNKQNGRKLTATIQDALKELRWTDFVVLNDNDMVQGFYLKELLRPSVYVYYLRDNFLAVDYWRKHGTRLEPALMKKADLIASNSLYLAAQAAKHNPASVYVGQGCDLTLFNPELVSAIPEDLLAIPSPRIGYTGALTTLRLDADLIEAVALRRPDWQVVLVGNTDDSFPIDRLQSLPNITFLGSRPPATVPAYLAGMDVLINPQVFNEVTIGNYPRKIDEYLAMGKPVVAVRTETMELFRDHVFLAEGTDAFVEAIGAALAGKELSTPQERIGFALEHTWENSVGLLLDAIRQTQSNA